MRVGTGEDEGPVYQRPTIVVYPLKANKRPVGFAPWPEPVKPKRKPARKPRKPTA